MNLTLPITISQNFFPEEAKKYVDESIENLDYLPDFMSKFMDNNQRDIFYKYSPAYASSEYTKRDNKDSVTSYYLITKKMTLKNYTDLSTNQRSAFVQFIKDLITTKKIDKYPYLKDVLPGKGTVGRNDYVPGFKVENNKLYFNFDNSWYGEDTAQLRESIYKDWDRYLMLKRAGLLK
jgi:hypothetical protein